MASAVLSSLEDTWNCLPLRAWEGGWEKPRLPIAHLQAPWDFLFPMCWGQLQASL